MADAGGRGRRRRPATIAGTWRWPVLGVLVVAALAALDVVMGLVVPEPTAMTNITGTFALAPALTGVGGTRRQTGLVGVLAVAVGATLCQLDGVMTQPALARTLVVAAGAVLAMWVAGLRDEVVVQLQDRREAARTLQAAMLTALPEPEHLELASRYLPASSGDQVGGDWYDAVVTPDGAVVVAIGDVTGHDISAAASMGQLRAMLRAYAVDRAEAPSRLLERLETSAELLGLDVLATAVVARVEEDEDGRRWLRWANAGHPRPLLVHADGEVAALGPEPDLMLGVDPAAGRTDHVVELVQGSTVLLHTDGLVERRDTDIDVGTHRLVDRLGALAGLPLGNMLDRLLADVLAGEHSDDVAVLAVRALPVPRERPPRPAGRGARPGPPDLVVPGRCPARASRS